MTDLTVANTIKSQIQALDPIALMSYGANKFVGTEDSLQFMVNGLAFRGKVIITLTPMDDYSIVLGRINTKTMEFVCEHKIEGVYCDQLVQILDKYVEGWG